MLANRLTIREHEVLICLSKGMTTSETAKDLFLSHETVKTHRSKIMQKLKARNAFQMGIHAMRLGLLDYNIRIAS